MTDFMCYRIEIGIDGVGYSNFMFLGNGDGSEPEIDWNRLVMPTLFGLTTVTCIPGFWDGKKFAPYKEAKS